MQVSVTNPVPELSRVAIVPFFNQSQEPTVDGRRFALAYYSELQKIPGFEVVPVGVAERAVSEQGLTLNKPADAVELARTLNVDAVVVGAVTDYDPYYPPRVGLSVRWYSPHDVQFRPGVPVHPQSRRWWHRILPDSAPPMPGPPSEEAEEHAVVRGQSVGEWLPVSGVSKPSSKIPALYSEISTTYEKSDVSATHDDSDVSANDDSDVSANSARSLERIQTSRPDDTERPESPRPFARSEDTRRLSSPDPERKDSDRFIAPEWVPVSDHEDLAPDRDGDEPEAGPQLVERPRRLRRPVPDGEAATESDTNSTSSGSSSGRGPASQSTSSSQPPRRPRSTLPSQNSSSSGSTRSMSSPDTLPDSPIAVPGPTSQDEPVEPVMSYTRIFDGDDADLVAALRDYVELSGDLRSGGWEAYLQRSEDFIRFASHMMIVEMLMLHGGEARHRIIFTGRKYK